MKFAILAALSVHALVAAQSTSSTFIDATSDATSDTTSDASSSITTDTVNSISDTSSTFSTVTNTISPTSDASSSITTDTTTPTSATSSAASTSTAGSGQAANQFVMVGPNNGFTFSPNSITAAVNTTVTFLFPTSGGFVHSVTQSSFANPCTLLDGGFDSGLQPNNMEFTITITNASQPIWFYCKQTAPIKHCGQGMVGGINIPAGSSNTVDKFVAAAKAIGSNEGAQTASGGLSGVGAVATAPAASTSVNPSAITGGTNPSQTSPTAGGSASTTNKPNGADRLIIGAGSSLAGLFTVIYTLA